MRLTKKSGVVFLIILISAMELLMESVSLLRYWDEILAVIFFVYLIINIGSNRKQDRYFGFIIISLLVLGIFGNVFYGYQHNKIAILMDIVANFKLPICCYGFYKMVSKMKTDIILWKLKPFAIVFIVAGFICCIVSMFVDIGMRGQQRYGIWGFNFICEYAHVFSMFVLTALTVVYYTVKKKSQRLMLLFCGFFQLVLTLKGISIGAVGAFVIIYYVLAHRNKIKIWNIIVIAVVGLVLGAYQINEYFFENAYAPRAMLLSYGLKTMINCFPIGSGFATFASDMANKYYSDLYRAYGFHLNWGTREGSQFLNDSWWPIVMAQFGIVGMVIVMNLFYKLFRSIQSIRVTGNKKIMLMTSFFYLLIASLGTSVFTTSVTIILIFIMILVLTAIRNEVN